MIYSIITTGIIVSVGLFTSVVGFVQMQRNAGGLEITLVGAVLAAAGVAHHFGAIPLY